MQCDERRCLLNLSFLFLSRLKVHASVPTLNAPKTNVSVLEGKTTVLPCSFEKRGSSQVISTLPHVSVILIHIAKRKIKASDRAVRIGL